MIASRTSRDIKTVRSMHSLSHMDYTDLPRDNEEGRAALNDFVLFDLHLSVSSVDRKDGTLDIRMGEFYIVSFEDVVDRSRLFGYVTKVEQDEGKQRVEMSILGRDAEGSATTFITVDYYNQRWLFVVDGLSCSALARL